MIKRPVPDTKTFEPYLSLYRAQLRAQRYSESTRHSYHRCVAHFVYWVAQTHIHPQQINEGTIREFLIEHLAHCGCPFVIRRSAHENRAALHLFLEVLPPSKVASSNPIGRELAEFDAYMERTCGLARNTRYQRTGIVRRFLTHQFGSGAIDLSRVTPAALRRFVLGGQGERTPGTIHVFRGALACYLRFRSIRGCRVAHLVSALPSVANWRLATLPEVLSEDEIQQVLDSFQRLTHSPKRAYAMARCLIDLGLRANEVANLHLDDLDWRASTIRLSPGKSRRADILPLPAETGAAIADYIRSERPQSSNRALFVRHVAPYDKPILAGVVRRAIREAYQRCSWSRTRVHILRHTIASRLLQAGTPLKEIADLLRHRSLDSSFIYTKVDLKRLSAVAMPWPGRSL